MKDNERPDIVDEHLKECFKLLKEFNNANYDVLMLLPDDEKDADQTFWFKPKQEQFNNFMSEAERWIATTRQQNEDVSPDDSVSVTVTPDENKSGLYVTRSTASSHSSRSSRSSRASSISSIRQKEQAERAALLARAASLKQKQALDLEECKLKAKRISLRSRQLLLSLQPK